jgi:hypothetical protein
VAFYIIMVVIAALGGVAYLTLFFSQVPGAKAERLGQFEPLPESLGAWVTDPTPNAEGLIRQSRTLFDGEPDGPGTFTYQVRLRHPESNEIVSVLPEVITKRRRAKVT